MNQLKLTRSNLHALGVKLNRLAEQRLLEEMENLEEDLKRFWSKVEKKNDCWEWNGCTRNGYGQFKIFKRKLLPHRISFILTNKKLIPFGLYVCHSCDNKKCVNPSHLWIGTNKDNQIDAVIKGRNYCPNGELSANCKLTDENVMEIRKLSYNGVKGRILAKKYNVSYAEISRIKNRRRWIHL